MDRNMAFFMKNNAVVQEENEIEGIGAFRYPDDGEGFCKGDVIPFVIKTVPTKIRDRLRKQCTLFKGKKHNRHEEFDKTRFQKLLIIEGCGYPDFRDVQLLESYGCVDPADLVDRILCKPGDQDRILLEILEFNGYLEDEEELVEEAKN